MFNVYYTIFMVNDVFNKYAPEDLSEFGLRDIKFGRSRLAILKAFLESMSEMSYEEILIKDLCRLAEVSEPSFYNYFPRKDDLFLYFISLWSVDAQLFVSNEKKGINTIRKIYSYTARQVNSFAIPLMKEIIAYQARTNARDRLKHIKSVTIAEKTLVFGKVPGIEKIPDQGLEQILQLNLIEALNTGELSQSTNLEAVGLILGSLFFGLPVILLHTHPEALESSFEASLDYIFKKL